EPSDLAAYGGVIRLVKIVTGAQSDIGIEPVIVSRESLAQLRVQRRGKLIRDLCLCRVNGASHRGATCPPSEGKRIYSCPQSVKCQVDKILYHSGNFLPNTPAQRTDWNVWVTFVVFQPITDPANNVFLNCALEYLKKFAVGDVLIQSFAQIGGHVVDELCAVSLDGGRVVM